MRAIRSSTVLDPHQFDFNLFEKNLEEYHADFPVSAREWSFILPININLELLNSGLRAKINSRFFEVTDSEFVKGVFYDLQSKCGNQVELQLDKRQMKTDWPAFIVFKSFGRTVHHAFAEAAGDLWAFRGMLELSHGGLTTVINIQNDPIRAFRIESWAIALSDDGYDYVPIGWQQSTWNNEDGQLRPSKRFDERSMMYFRWLRASVRRSRPKDIGSLLYRCFVLYADVVDQVWDIDQFLHLWRIAETVTLSEKSGGSTDVVCSRFAIYVKKDGLNQGDVVRALQGLARVRNKWVHQGLPEGTDQHINNEFRAGCVYAILWLSRQLGRIGSENDLDKWYSYLNVNNKDLQSIQDMASLVLESRKS